MEMRPMRSDGAVLQNGATRPAVEISADVLRRLYDDAPVLVTALSSDGMILYCSPTLARHVGRDERDLLGVPACTVFGDDSGGRLLDLARHGGDGPRQGPLTLKLRRADGSEEEIEALVDHARLDRDRHCLRVVALEGSLVRRRICELERSVEMLRGMIESSTEPTWCIAYSEPVDITVSDREIIRQVFENECYWSMCNDAMARLYDLPEDLDFNRQPVGLYFPRSPENEAFVQSILDAGFHIDHALSVDQRHDGTPLYVENSVRCHIEDGRMLRMWGTLRDVTHYQRIQNELTMREREVRGLLSAIADIVVMVDGDGRLQAANPAFRRILGWAIDDWLGHDISAIVDLNGQLRKRPDGGVPCRFPVEARQSNGTAVLCDVVMSAADHGDGANRFVAVLRPQSTVERTLA